MKKFFLKHSTTYKYSNNVSESSNKIHLYPYNENTQQIINHKITVSGNPTISTYLDDYNNMVGYFNHLPPHKYLMILSEAEIIKTRIIMPEDIVDISTQWETLKSLKNSIDFLPFLKISSFKNRIHSNYYSWSLMSQLLHLKSQCFEEFFLNIYQHS